MHKSCAGNGGKMNQLLSANFMRLKKNKLFWGGLIFICLFGLLLVNSQYREHIKYGYEVSLDNIFLGYTLPIGIIMAVFSSIFLGTEYSDGTIRNKLIIGHSRLKIYFSNLITNIIVSFIVCLVFLVTVTAVGTPLIGFVTKDIKAIVVMFFGSFILAAAFCSIFTLFSMVCGNKAAVAIISILLVVGMFLITTMIDTKLNAPEYWNSYEMGEEGVESQMVLNPEYLTETKRAFYEFLFDFLPTGQSLQYANMSVNHLWQMPLYSLIIAVITTISGVIIFQRKDLK